MLRSIKAFNGTLAQLAEQGTFNPKVVGSTPTRPTIKVAARILKFSNYFYLCAKSYTKRALSQSFLYKCKRQSTPAPVYLTSVCDLDDEDEENPVFDVADDTVVANPIAPKASHVSDESLARASWIFELRDLAQLRDNPPGNLLVNLPHRPLDVFVDLNPPGQGFPPARRSSPSRACRRASPRPS